MHVFCFVAGMVGIICLLLSVRLAHASLQHKLNSRSPSKQKVSANISEYESDNKLDAEEKLTETDSEIKPVGRKRMQSLGNNCSVNWYIFWLI